MSQAGMWQGVQNTQPLFNWRVSWTHAMTVYGHIYTWNEKEFPCLQFNLYHYILYITFLSNYFTTKSVRCCNFVPKKVYESILNSDLKGINIVKVNPEQGQIMM